MGTLYLVSTPIGNLMDITFRAIETLKAVDFILCEDTRVTGKLLKNFEIQNSLVSFNEFNENSKLENIISDLRSGKNIALVSDAGTPLVSDPGFKLVREAQEAGIGVDAIPGSSSPIVALTISGMPPDKFVFLGYLPKKESKRKEILKKVGEVRSILKATIICFESPYRLVRSLSNIEEILGDVEIVVCRELTKMHQEVRREKASEALEHFKKVAPRGEFVIVF